MHHNVVIGSGGGGTTNTPNAGEVGPSDPAPYRDRVAHNVEVRQTACPTCETALTKAQLPTKACIGKQILCIFTMGALSGVSLWHVFREAWQADSMHIYGGRALWDVFLACLCGMSFSHITAHQRRGPCSQFYSNQRLRSSILVLGRQHATHNVKVALLRGSHLLASSARAQHRT